MRITVTGRLPRGSLSKDLVLYLIGRYGERTGTDHMLLRVQWPGLGQKTVLKTLERLGRVVEKLK